KCIADLRSAFVFKVFNLSHHQIRGAELRDTYRRPLVGVCIFGLILTFANTRSRAPRNVLPTSLPAVFIITAEF
ncbi:MAG: hypothetical protein WCX28_00290, partial [Bacteriovoracaceae bacterium]